MRESVQIMLWEESNGSLLQGSLLLTNVTFVLFFW